MPFDYYLLAGFFVCLLGILAILAAMVDQRSPLSGIIISAVGGGLGYYAWVLSEETLVTQDVPNAFFRVVGALLS